jgi:protein-glutamine gamma-glutamyltransferase
MGFSGEVTLDALDEIIESQEEVMQVSLYDHRTNEPYPLVTALHLRGAALTTYQGGRWIADPIPDKPNSPVRRHAAGFPQEGLVRQEIAIVGTDRNELFCVAPYILVDPRSSAVRVDRDLQRLSRPDDLSSQPFSYKLATTALVNGVQRALVPASPDDVSEEAMQLFDAIDRGAMPHLVELADRWIRESGLPPGDRVGRTRCLERQLATSGSFSYSLVGQPRDATLDPIEDFVTKHPRGHCEYFATALVLMLRSQGIPARLVMGYKCVDADQENPWWYHARQSDAHAWAEAYLEPSQLPANLLHGNGYWPWSKLGGWLQLDPSPASPTTASTLDRRNVLERWRDWFNSLWSNYVEAMNRRRQYTAIYQPIARAIRSIQETVYDPAWWGDLANRLLAKIAGGGGPGIAARGLLGAAAAGGLVLLVALGRRIWPHARNLRLSSGNARRFHRKRQGAPVEFYRRLEAILERNGMVRAVNQTQREFAAAVGDRLTRIDGGGQFAPPVAAIVEAYYHVRFGQQPLSDVQAHAVEHGLAAMKSLKVPHARPSRFLRALERWRTPS